MAHEVELNLPEACSEDKVRQCTERTWDLFSAHLYCHSCSSPLQQPHRQLELQNLELSLAQGNSHYLPSKSGKKTYE